VPFKTGYYLEVPTIRRLNNNKDNYDRLKNAFNKGIRVVLW
jgi:hypothetical protein